MSSTAPALMGSGPSSGPPPPPPGGPASLGSSLRPVLQPHSINNIAQHQPSEDLLLTQNSTHNTAAVPPPQQQQRPIWAGGAPPVTSGTSPIGILTPTAAAPGGVLGCNNQNWIHSRPNSTSIHTPSPTNLAPVQQNPMGPPPGVSAASALPPPPGGAGGGATGRLPPPLAPITSTQQPPSTLPPPAYTPPTHLSGSGFQSSPHSSSWR